MSIFRPNILDGKTVVVTGGGSGIGLDIGRYLANHGARVAIMGRSLKRLEEAKATFPEGNCIISQCDVRNTEQISSSVTFILNIFGKIDVLVNSAAGNFLAPFEKLSPKGFKTVLEIDTMGTFNVCKEVFSQAMSKSGSGVIINISSTLQMPCVYMQIHATVAKAGIDSLTKCLALELGPKGIRVNAVAPGAIEDTEGFSRLTPKGESSVDFKNYIPLQKYGKCNDISEAILFMIVAPYVTGQVFVVDGGLTLTVPNFTLLHPDAHKLWRAKL